MSLNPLYFSEYQETSTLDNLSLEGRLKKIFFEKTYI